MYLTDRALPYARIMALLVREEILTVQPPSGTLPAGSLIRAQAVDRNQVLSVTCRGGTALLPAPQSSILFRQREVPEAAEAVILPVDLPVDLLTVAGLLPADQEVHSLPDLLPQVHPDDLHHPLILQEEGDKTIDVWFPLDSSFLKWSAGIVFQKMKKNETDKYNNFSGFYPLFRTF